MRDNHFEWDDNKAASNLIAHGVTFEMARDVFKDPLGIDQQDEHFDYGEDRANLIGLVNGRLLFVAYTMRDTRIRIISTRGAEPHEHRQYHEDNA
jgi:uncharacterized protein